MVRLTIFSASLLDKVHPQPLMRQEMVTKLPIKFETQIGSHNERNCSTARIDQDKTTWCCQQHKLYQINPHLHSIDAINRLIKMDEKIFKHGLSTRSPIAVTPGCTEFNGGSRSHHRKCLFASITTTTPQMTNEEILFIEMIKFHSKIIKDKRVGNQFQESNYVETKKNTPKNWERE